jgi:hypothetical protein
MVGRLAAGAALTLDAIEVEMMELYVLEDKDTKVNTKQESDKKTFKKFTGKCNRCGNVGHKEANCWDYPKNGDCRPKSWETRDNSSSNVAEIALVTFKAYTSLIYEVDRETYFNKELGCYDCTDNRPIYREDVPFTDAVQVNHVKWHDRVPCGVSRLPCGTEFFRLRRIDLLSQRKRRR